MSNQRWTEKTDRAMQGLCNRLAADVLQELVECKERLAHVEREAVRISPEVRETILRALSLALGESMMESYEVNPAIAFVEALP